VTFACLKVAHGRRWALVGVCVVGSGVSMLVMAALYEPGDPSRAYYGTDARAHALLIGVLLAILLDQWKPERGRARMLAKAGGWAGAAYMLFAFTRIGDTDAWMYRGGLALFAVSVALVITSVVQRWRYPVRTALSWSPVVWIGKISYGLYLWHWPVIVVMTPARVGIDGTPLNLLRVAVTLAISTASFYLVEMPIRRGVLKRKLAIAVTPAAFAVAGLAVVAATAGAEPPPEFAQQGTVITADSDDGSTNTSEPTGDNVPVDPTAPQRVLLVGDSVAASLLPGLEAVTTERGMQFAATAQPGCGVVGGITTDENGEPFDWSEACDRNAASTYEQSVLENNPDLVVWLSTWETADRIVAGEQVEFGTDKGDQVLTQLIDEAVARLTSGGARVVFLTIAPHAEPNENDLGDTNNNDANLAHLNELLVEYAEAHPDTTSVIDVVELLCPDREGPCPAEVDGVRPRPRDGRHFEGDGPRWLAEWLVPQLTVSPAS
jgi:SGNH domain (fused to AT3 domains)/Acyltransferase family